MLNPLVVFFSSMLNQFVDQIDDFLGEEEISKIAVQQTRDDLRDKPQDDCKDDYPSDAPDDYQGDAPSHSAIRMSHSASHGTGGFDEDLIRQLLGEGVKDPERLWVPKVPRRVIPLMWPSVMNPHVYDEVNNTRNKDQLLEVNREHPGLPGSPYFNITEVTKVFGEVYRNKEFLRTWNNMRLVILWATTEIPKHGFRTIYPKQVDTLYKLINNNRKQWITGVQLLVERLVKAIVVLHDKKIVTRKYLDEYNNCNKGSWLENWEEYFECWTKNTQTGNVWKMPFYFFKEYIYKSYDIVTAWLYDYVAQHLATDKDNHTMCALGFGNKFEIQGFLIPRKTWFENAEKFLNAQKDDIKEMKHKFFTCKVNKEHNDCTSSDRLSIQLARYAKGNTRVTLIPDVLQCYFDCTDIPGISEEHKAYFYWSASLTTSLGHFFSPHIGQNEHTIQWVGGHYKVRTSVVPRVVQKYILDQQPCCLDEGDKCESVWGEVWTQFRLPKIHVEKTVTLFKNGTFT